LEGGALGIGDIAAEETDVVATAGGVGGDDDHGAVGNPSGPSAVTAAPGDTVIPLPGAKRARRPKRTNAVPGKWCAFVSFDLEVTGASRAAHEPCQIGGYIFALQRPGGDWGEVGMLGDGGNKFCSFVKPSTAIKWDDGPGGTGTHGITASEVEGAPGWVGAMQAFFWWIQGRVAVAGVAMGVELPSFDSGGIVVCLVAHNGKATDFDWAAHMCSKFKLELPAWLSWVWGTLPAVKADAHFKVTKGMLSGGTPAPAGNINHGLAEVYKAITKRELLGHHDAGTDAYAGAMVALRVFEKRCPWSTGMVEWTSIVNQKEKGVKLAQGSLLPDLSGGPWSYNSGGVPNTGMPPPGKG